MKEPRLIMGKSVARYILEGIFISALFLVIAFWAVSFSLKLANNYLEASNSSEPIFLVYTPHFLPLIASIGIFIAALFIFKETLIKIFEWEDKSISKKIDRILLIPFVASIFLAIPLTYAGHFLTKYQITQKGYYYCGSLRLKDRFYRAFVLEKEDCHDSRLQRIMLQYDKKNHLILEEANQHLRTKGTEITNQSTADG